MSADTFDDDARGGGALVLATWTARARRILSWPVRVAQARALLGTLGRMSERELADIGLSRADLCDATALPLGDDPSPFLGTRIAEWHDAARRSRSAPWHSTGHRRPTTGQEGYPTPAPIAASVRRSH